MRQHLIPVLLLTAAWTGADSRMIPASAQVAPSLAEQRAYTGLHAAAAKGDVETIDPLASAGEVVDARDTHGRTPLHVALHGGHQGVAQALLRHGADANALEAQRYDVVTIASVRNDVAMLKLALAAHADPRAITSPYDGTALIAAAHLGHAEVVRTLIDAGAPLDHVNNLGWTALIESIVLGNGGRNHTDTLRALVQAGADVNIADRQGATPLRLARTRGYSEMARILEAVGARP